MESGMRRDAHLQGQKEEFIPPSPEFSILPNKINPPSMGPGNPEFFAAAPDYTELRDRFAEKAMQAFIRVTKNLYAADTISTAAYEMADAMIKERNKNG